MKKILVILTLALALCLIYGTAMADVVEKHSAGVILTYKENTGAADELTIDKDPVEIIINGKKFVPQKVSKIVVPYTNAAWQDSITFTHDKPCVRDGLEFHVWYKADDGEDFTRAYTINKVGEYTIWDHEKGTTKYNGGAVDHCRKYYLCEVCGEKLYIDEWNHDWKDVVDVKATCETEGKMHRECKVCGDNEGITYDVEKGGHNWVLHIDAPHCNPDMTITLGTAYVQCADCDKYVKLVGGKLTTWEDHKENIQESEVTDVKEVETNIDEARYKELTGEECSIHDWYGWHEIDNDCYKAGYRIHYCKRCNHDEVAPYEPASNPKNFPKVPEWKVVVLNEKGYTCIAELGVDYEIRCKFCNGAAPGHKFNKVGAAVGAPDANGVTYSLALTNVGTLKDVNIRYEYKITNDKDATVTPIEHLVSHAYKISKEYLLYEDDGKTVHVDHVATCLEDSHRFYRCINDKDQKKFSAITHAPKAVVDTPKTNHNFGAWKMIEAPEPEKNAPGRWVRVCQNKYCLDYTGSDHAQEELKQFEYPCKENEHDWKLETIKDYTCTTDGVEALVCQKCRKVQDGSEKVIKAKHHLGAPLPVIAPTCTEAGLSIQICSVCGYHENVPVDALGHDIVTDPEVAPTCNKAGLTAGEHCTRCDYKVPQEEIPATGKHNFEGAEMIVIKPATCEEAGEGIVKCIECGEAVEKHTIDAEGHNLEDKEGKDATCEEAGYTAYKACTKCDYVEGKEVIPALGHDLQKIPAVAATCTEDGATEGYGCTRCDYMVVAPTVLPALGHDIVKDAAVAATCTEAGLTEGEHCSRCDYKVEQEVVEALGHDFGEYTVTKEATPFEDGEKVAVCSRCGEEDKVEFEFVPEKDPAYTVEAIHDGEYVTGAVEHDPWTKEADKLFVRVTLFLADGTTSISVSIVNEDGTFEVGATGNIVHIEIALTGTAKAVKPGYSYYGGCDL